MRVGETHRWDSQADIFGGQYKVIQNLGRGRWLIERLPADEQTQQAILDFWASVEARGGMTTPVWDKTWAECGEGEYPQKTGWTSYEEELERELARYAELAGTTMELQVVSRERYARHF